MTLKVYYEVPILFSYTENGEVSDYTVWYEMDDPTEKQAVEHALRCARLDCGAGETASLHPEKRVKRVLGFFEGANE